jgi:microsomal dipeptidase-like Zn-dependent dipeptidase
MSRAAVALLAVGLALTGCSSSSAPWPSPPRCEPIASPPDSNLVAGGDGGVVWGFADLHAHPATELAFGRRLIWGHAINDAPVSANELPMIDTCPVETHDLNASTPLDHEVGSVAFPIVAQVANFAHGPVGEVTLRPSSAWPNARDVIHQQMNVASIRRAYEGGLRLMFASTTDDQMVGALLAGPSFANAFVPDKNADFNSAQAQILLIERMVEQNKSWMQIVRTPGEARDAIGNGKLALVLSLEMNGLARDQVDRLVDDYGVAHIIPVHLIDNDVGGTAVNSDMFNASGAEASEIYRSDTKPLQYMDLAPSVAFSPSLGRPDELTTFSVPVYANVNPIPFAAYDRLCYEPLSFCEATTPQLRSFIHLGQVNFRGLCSTSDECARGDLPGAARIAHMMSRCLIVDVSHMGFRSVRDTLGVSPDSPGGACPYGDPTPGRPSVYPLIASHGDIAHLCDSPDAPHGCKDFTELSDPLSPTTGNERSLDATQARNIVHRGGVLGLGTGVHSYMTHRIFEARGGPLLKLDLSNGSASGCAATGGAGGCARAVDARAADDGARATDGGAPPQVTSLTVQIQGDFLFDTANPLNAYPYVRVDLLGQDRHAYERRAIEAPLDCSPGGCTATVDLGTLPGTVSLTTGPDGGVTAMSPAGSFAIKACSDVNAGACTGSDCVYTVDHIDGVSVEMRYLAGPDVCSQSSSDDGAPTLAIQQASVLALTSAGQVPLESMTGTVAAPIARLDGTRGSFSLYQRGDRPSIDADIPASRVLRVSIGSGGERVLQGASTTQPGANVCVALRRKEPDGTCRGPAPLAAGATECPAGWASVNQRGGWATGTSLYAFLRGDPASVCGVDVAVVDAEPTPQPWTIDEVEVRVIEDPVGHFVRRYAAISNYVAGEQLGAVAFGTDFNGLNGMMDISEQALPATAQNPSACLQAGPDTPTDGAAESAPSLLDAGDASAEGGLPPPGRTLAPMRLRHSDGSLGGEVRIDERGLATYGLLADMMAIIKGYGACGPDVYESLMLSAEMTLRAWEKMRGDPPRTQPLPTRHFCGDAGAGP